MSATATRNHRSFVPGPNKHVTPVWQQREVCEIVLPDTVYYLRYNDGSGQGIWCQHYLNGAWLTAFSSEEKAEEYRLHSGHPQLRESYEVAQWHPYQREAPWFFFDGEYVKRAPQPLNEEAPLPSFPSAVEQPKARTLRPMAERVAEAAKVGGFIYDHSEDDAGSEIDVYAYYAEGDTSPRYFIGVVNDIPFSCTCHWRQYNVTCKHEELFRKSNPPAPAERTAATQAEKEMAVL